MRKFDWRSLLRYQGGSMLMVVCGLILTICPDSASVLISGVLGWLLIALGVFMLVVGILGGIEILSILQGAGLMLAGAWLHRHPLMIVSVLGVVLGFVTLCQGWQKAKRARRIKRYGGFWQWEMLMAVLELLVGLVLVFTPRRVSRLVLTLAGIFLVICGGADMVAFWKGGSDSNGYSSIIDADR